MKSPTKLPTLRKADGTIKPINTSVVVNNFHRMFYKQAIPLFENFANKSTMILLYLLFNADTNNYIYCTYADIMYGCSMTDKALVASVLKELVQANAIVKVSNSHYMLNPAISLKGNDKKFQTLMDKYDEHVKESKKKENTER